MLPSKLPYLAVVWVIVLLLGNFQVVSAVCHPPLSGADCCFETGGAFTELYITAPEDLAPGSVVYTFDVSPPDSVVEWSCKSPPTNDQLDPCFYLEVDGKNLIYKETFDIEDPLFFSNIQQSSGIILFTPGPGSQYQFTCNVPGSSPVDGSIDSRITFQNVNEPANISAIYNATVLEHSPVGSTIYFDIPIVAADPDIISGDSYGDFTCQLQNEDTIPFSVSCETTNNLDIKRASAEVTLTVNGLLDYEGDMQAYDIILSITDTTDNVVNNDITVTTTLHIGVTDTDDLNPAFSSSLYQASIDEIYAGLLIVTPKVEAFDQDTGAAEPIGYSLLEESDYLEINSSTGAITVIKSFDREVIGDQYSVDIVARQMMNTVRFATAQLTVTINDINDNCPGFDQSAYTGQVSPDDYYVTQKVEGRLIIIATDPDQQFEGELELQQDGKVFGVVESPVPVETYLEFYLTLLEPQNLGPGGTVHTLQVSVISGVISGCSNSTTITVEVVDLDPVFLDDSYIGYINEMDPVGTIVLTVNATNSDDTDKGISYVLKSATDNGQNIFMINEATGVITVQDNNTDVDGGPDSYTLVVEAQDRRNDPTRSTSTTVTVYVNDINDNCPGFDQSLFEGKVSPDDYYVTENGEGRLIIIATDKDKAFEGELELLQDGEVFGLAESPVPVDAYLEFYLTLLEPQNLGPGGTVHELQVSVISGIISGCSNSTTITVEVVDLDPVFLDDGYIGYINEMDPVGTIVLTVNATNSDDTDKGISYVLKSATDNGQNVFMINEATGVITVQDDNTDVDGGPDSYTLVVEAQDRRNDPTRSTSTTVTVYVNDINDNCPGFDQSLFEGKVSPDDYYVTENGEGRLIIIATDKDKAFEGELELLQDGEVFGLVESPVPVDAYLEFYLTLLEPQNLGPGGTVHELQVSVISGIISGCSNSTTITVEVVDLDPVFLDDGYIGYINEMDPVGTIVLTVNATNSDDTAKGISYVLKSATDNGQNVFMINEATGVITVQDDKTDVDAGGPDSYTLVVEAQDRRNDPTRSTSTTVTVYVDDINDNCPGFDQSLFAGKVSPDDFYVTENGEGRLIIIATDLDKEFEGELELQQNGKVFGLVESPVHVDTYIEFYLTLLEPQNLGIGGAIHELQVSVISGVISGCSKSTNITVEVVDLDPVFLDDSYIGYINEMDPVGTIVLTVNATNSDDNDIGISYVLKSATDNGQNIFMINEATGVITVQDDNNDVDSGGPDSYTLVVEAQDRRNDPTRSTSTTVTVYVNDINDNCPGFIEPPAVYYGELSSQDVYVVDPMTSQRLMLTAQDPDQEYIADTDMTDARFEIEQALSADNQIVYYITVEKFSQLTLGESYLIQVSLTDPSQPTCNNITTVNITAVDLSPVFDQEEYPASIEENTVSGTSVFNVSATTFDDVEAVVFYGLRSSSPVGTDHFQINEMSGEITIQDGAVIDAEDVSLYTLVVEAQDRRYDPIRSATATVFVEILDINDNCPVFSIKSLAGQISSQDVFVVTSGNERLILEATDQDIGGFNGTATVTDDDDTDAGFVIEIAPSSGGRNADYYIKVTDFSKLEIGMMYTIQVTLTDASQTPICNNVTSVDITAVDLSPIFDKVEYPASIEENNIGGSSVVNVSATTFDGVEDVVFYGLRSSSHGTDIFQINEMSGEITIQDGAVIDAEVVSLYTLVVEAQDRRYDPIRSATTTVFVEILDINDNCPVFSIKSLPGQISSQDVFVVTSGNKRLIHEATDQDIGGFNGTATVTDDDDTDAGFVIEIAPSSGGRNADYYIKVTDFSKLKIGMMYTIQVTLTDESQTPICNNVTSVDITAVDLSPIFDKVEYPASIEENNIGGSSVVNVSATTFDGVEDDVFYGLRSSSHGTDIFQINEMSGEITIQDGAVIDAEVVSLYTLVVEAQDRRYDPIRSATTTVFVEILDINDNCPVFSIKSLPGQISSQDVFVVTSGNERLILEATDQDIGGFNGTATVTDDDDTGAGFNVEIAPSSGGRNADYYIKVTDFSKLEIGLTYTLQVTLTDASQLPICNNVTSVDITAVDLSPVFHKVEYPASIEENSIGGSSVVNISAVTFDMVEGVVFYGLRSSSPETDIFQINEMSGEITIQDGAVIDAEVVLLYTLVVEAQDRRYDPLRSATASVFVTITDANDECPTFAETVYYGNITRQDVYVVDENLEQLLVIAVDPDSEFIGLPSLVADNPSFELFNSTPPSEVNSLYLSIKLVNQTGIQDGAVYSLRISIDDSACPSSIIADVMVTVSDSLAPVFNPPEYTTSIFEGAPFGELVTQVSAFRQDNSVDEIFYRLQSANNGGSSYFSVSPSGLITIKSDQTDAETVTEYTLVVEAEDRLANPPRVSSTTVIIQINNTNDNCPVFEIDSYSGIITEQDKYVVMGVDNLERLVIVPTDDDIGGFDGRVDLLTSDSIFGLEKIFSTDGTSLMVYVVLLDPTMLKTDNYTIQVAVTDNTTVPVIICGPSITNVTIQVVQDLAPEFTQDQYTGRIDEREQVGTTVATVEAESRNPGSSLIFYKLTKGNDLFQIDQISGLIIVKEDTTDFETATEHTLVVEAQDRGIEPFRTASVNVIVSVEDVNDNCPSFASNSYTGQVTLDDRFVLKYGTVDRLILTAMDNDSAFEGALMIHNDTSGGSFKIVEQSSSDAQILQISIEVIDSSGLELDESYELGILLTDTTVVTTCSSYVMVTVYVEDLSPKFTQKMYTGSVNETANPGTTIVTVNATNKDGNSDDIVYVIKSVTGDGFDKFTIDPTSGEITVSSALDAEVAQEYTLFVEALDTRTEIIRSATAKVLVTIQDVNDNCPRFTTLSLSGLLSSQDAFVVTMDYEERLVLEAVDEDVGAFIGNATVTQDDSGAGFQVEEVTTTGINSMGYYIKVIDFTALVIDNTYPIQITLQDIGNTYCNTPSIANVNITARDLAPVFTQSEYYANITEGAAAMTFVEQVSALNSDDTAQGIEYSLKSSTEDGIDIFTINATSGRITVVQDDSTNREDISEYVLVVEAQDRRLDPIRSSTANVFVRIDDVNDECSQFTSPAVSFGQITRQDVYVVSNTTQEVLVLRAQDGDLVFNGEYAITAGNPHNIFSLDDSTPPSEVEWLYLSIRLDEPELLIDGQLYALKVSIVDSDLGCSSEVDVIIASTESLAPTFELSDYQASIQEGTEPGTGVIQVQAYRQNDPTDDKKIFYRLQSASNNGKDVFAINDTTGIISVISDQTDVETITTEYVLIVEAEDRLTNPTRVASTSVIITVNNTNDRCPRFAQIQYDGVVTSQDKYVVNSATDLSRLVIIPLDDDIAGFDGDVILVDDSDGLFSIEEEYSVDGSVLMVYIVLNDPIKPGVHILQLSVTDDTTVPSVICPDEFTNVTVTVIDVEDLAPVFTQPEYDATIPEGSQIGTNVTMVTAESQNPYAMSGNIYYQLTLGNDMFGIDQNGVITVADVTNYELVKEYVVIVEAQDRGIEPFRSTSTSLIVYINDVNDECPLFLSDQYAGQISLDDTYVFENGTANRLILVASDLDSTFAGSVSIISDNAGNSFSLYSTSSPDESTMYWYITLNTVNSVVEGMDYQLQISVFDSPQSKCSEGSNTTVTIQVENLSPAFTNTTYYADVNESDDIGTLVVTVCAKDKDGSSDGVTYSLKSASDNGLELFKIDENSGEITILAIGLDADVLSKYTLFVEAQDTKLEVPRLATATVVVQVNNVNDICPVFEESVYTGSIGLGDEYVIGDGGSRLIITAVDMDLEFIGDVSLVDDSSLGGFDIEMTSSTDPALVEYYVIVKDALQILPGQDYFLQMSVTNSSVSAGCAPEFTDITVSVSETLAPSFDQPAYYGNITENEPGQVIQVNATRPDGSSAGLIYRIKSATSDGMSKFTIDAETGVIDAKAVDYESVQEYLLFVEAEDRNSEPFRSAGATVTVTVIDRNDKCPFFELTSYQGQITPGDVYVRMDGLPLVIMATDGDSVFEGTKSSTGGPYDLDIVNLGENPRLYYVVNTGNIDAPTDANITVTLTDGTCVDITMVTVTVVNDTQPYFESDRYNGSIPEMSGVGDPVLTVKAYNRDGSEAGLEYFLQSATNGGAEIFEVIRTTGEIKVKSTNTNADGPITEYSLFIEAQDRRIEDNIKSASTAAVIQITDINDNPPNVEPSFYQANISEDALLSYPVVTVMATDIDSDADLVYSFMDPVPMFDIDDKTGLIRLAGELNRDPPGGVDFYSIQVSVSDGVYDDTCIVNITVIDVNDNPPKFTAEPYDLSVLEDVQSASIQVSASDVDIGENGEVTYDLVPTERNVTMDPQSGLVTFNGPFDREEITQIVVTVIAMDGGMPTLSTTALVTLNLIDVNDEAPEFIQSSCNSIRLSEDTPVGTAVCTVLAVDGDEPGSPNSMVSYDVLGPDAAYFSIIMGSDGYGQLELASTLNWETQTTLQIRIQAKDGGTPVLTSSLNVTITVDDVNDNAPTFSQREYRVTFDEEIPAASPVTSISAEDIDETSVILCNITGGNKEYFFASSDGKVCTLTSAMPIPIDLTTPYTVTILAFNPDKQSLTSPNSEAIVNVFVGAELCFIDVDPDEYFETYKVEEVFDGVPVVNIVASSECPGDIGFNIISQTLLPDAESTIPEPSFDFFVDFTGAIFPNMTNVPALGLHQITVNVFNVSDPTYLPATADVYITILPDDNDPPVFDDNLEPDIVYIPKLQGDEVFNLEGKATDPNSPLIDVGEIFFEKIGEVKDDGSASSIFNVMEDGKIQLSQNLLDITGASYNVKLTVKVSDYGIPSLNDTAVIVFTIRPPVTNPPVFLPSSCDGVVEVPEGPRSTVPLCTVLAEGEDQVTYSMEDQRYFSINPMSGNITQDVDLDYEKPAQREFLLSVIAESNGLQNFTTVNISVTDINDNAPIFEEGGCFSTMRPPSVAENSASGVFVCSALAVDADPSDTVMYSLQGPDSDPFMIDVNGVISVKTSDSLDREDPLDKIYIFNVTAEDSRSPSMTTSRPISVTILDVNDEPPFFADLGHKVIFNDIVLPNTEIITVTSQDPDLPPGDIVLCEITSGGDGEDFLITSDGKNCTLLNSQQLENGRYTLTFVAFNPDQPSLRSQLVQVDVLVGGDYCLVDIELNEYDLTLKVDQVNAGVPVIDINATSSCGGGAGDIFYNIITQQLKPDSNDPPVISMDFEMDSSTGEISSVTNDTAFGIHTLEIEAFNTSDPDVSKDTALVVITILPATNTAPMFFSEVFFPDTIIVPQPASGSMVFDLALVANDTDSPKIGVGEITFEEISEVRDGLDPEFLFTVTPEGLIQLTEDLYILEPAFTVDLTVKVQDKGMQPLNDMAVVRITVEPPTPQFEKPCADMYYVDEGDSTPVAICQVIAVGGGDITYSLDSTYFNIDSDTGEISTRANTPFDYEDPEERRFTLLVTATASNDEKVTTIVEVVTNDINDNAPEFTKSGCLAADGQPSVEENSAQGVHVCTVTATDADAPRTNNSRIIYSLEGVDSDPFVIDENGAITVKSNDDLDRESQYQYTFIVKASDTGTPGLSTTESVTVDILDVNDNIPEFTTMQYKVNYDTPVEPGVSVITATPFDPDTIPGGDLIACNITSSNDASDMFFISSDGDSCTLSTSQQLENGRYTVSFVAFNPDQPSLRSQPVQVDVFVGRDYCFVDIEPIDYAVTLQVNEVNSGETVIDFNATSTCGGSTGDIVFGIMSQELQPGVSQPIVPSTDFTINQTTGVLSSISNDPAFGIHTMEIEAFNTSDPDVSRDTALVVITILPASNTAPMFFSDVFYPDTIIVPQPASGFVLLDLALVANDTDSPNIGVGEIIFERVSEFKDGTDPSNYFLVNEAGLIELTGDLYTIESAYTVALTVKVTDKGTPPLSDTAVVKVTVEPPIPEFDITCPGPNNVNEGEASPVLICTVRAVGGGDITYSLADTTYFTIDQNDGEINTAAEFDYEDPSQRMFMLVVTASSNAEQASIIIEVTVNDINDEQPKFEMSGCLTGSSVQENSQQYTSICTVTAFDADAPSTNNSKIVYSLQGPGADPFEINADSGVITVRLSDSLDRETKDMYSFTVVATDRGSRSLSTSVAVTITITDVNDIIPEFTQLQYRVEYETPVEPGTSIITAPSFDDDNPPFNVVNCEVVLGDNSELFFVSSNGDSCTLANSQQLENGRYTVLLVAFNPDQEGLLSQPVQVDVFVGRDYCFVDIEPNDYAVTLEVDEVNLGETIVDLNATSTCGGSTGDIEFNVVAQQLQPDVNQPPMMSTDFDINSSTGEIWSTTNDPAFGIHTMVIEAYNTSEPDASRDTSMVVITILPAVNAPPMFTNDTFYPDVIIIPQQINTFVFNLADVASDADSPKIGVGEITFVEVSENKDGTDPNLFTVTPGGLIQLTSDLYEYEPAFTVDLTVKVEDKGTPPLSDTAVVRITVEPPTPEFDVTCPGPNEINEGEMKAVFICQVKAIGGGEITYSLDDDEYFTIGSSTGEIYSRANKPLDYEEPEQRQILLVVTATATTGNVASTYVEILVNDINDEAPVFAVNECVEVMIPEDSILNTPVCRVLAVDMDGSDNARITYSLIGDNKDLFEIRPDGNDYGVIYTNSMFDREIQPSRTLTIVAMDSGSPSLNSTSDIIIGVEDINDSPPEFLDAPIRVIYENPIEPGIEITSVTAEDSDEYPYNIRLCKLSSPNNSSDYFYVSSDGVSCTLFTAKRVDLQPSEPYIVIITAYNPDMPDLKSDASSIEVRVYVSNNKCFAVIQPGDHVVRKEVTDVVKGDPVVAVKANSTCTDGSEGDTLFSITMQEFSPFPGEPLTTSANFTINNTTGIISSEVNTPATGVHTMRVIAYHSVDPENSVDEVQVEITIVADFNMKPSFDQAIYNMTLISPILNVPREVLDLEYKVNDLDLGEIGNGQLSFSQLSIDPNDGLFEVTETGQINLVNILIEEDEAYMVNISVGVTDKGVPPLSDRALVYIYIKLPESGVKPPEFEPDDCVDLAIDEEQETEPPIPICQVQASSESGSEVTYSLDAEFFQIDPSTGQITTNEVLDYENPGQRQFVLLVQASSVDGNAYKPIEVVVMDINDEIPQFDLAEYTFNIIEEMDCPGYIGRVHATDADTDEDNVYVEYRLNVAVANIAVDALSGNISTTGCIDRDTPEYQDGFIVFDVLAENVNADENADESSAVVVRINIEDMNDNSPVFSAEQYDVETTPLTKDMFIIQVEAIDIDQGSNGEVYYLLDETQDELIFEFFKINQENGEIRTRLTEFPLEPTEYLINVLAYDRGSPPNTDEATVMVFAGNLENPFFRPEDQVQRISFMENSEADICANFTAPLFNETLGVQYQIVNNTSDFKLKCVDSVPYLCVPSTGLDREEQDLYSIVILASTGTEPCSIGTSFITTDVSIELETDQLVIELETDQVVIDVTILDVNDNKPEFVFDGNRGKLNDIYYIGVADDAMYNASVFQIQASDKDLDSTFNYSITQNSATILKNSTCYGNPKFAIDDTGAVRVRDTLYTHLDGPRVQFEGQQSLCDYTVVVDDTMLTQDVGVKLKILRVYEHIIISSQKPPQEIVQQIDTIISCLDRLIPEYVLFVQDIRAFLLSSAVDFSLVEPDWTDIWLYAVDTNTLEFAKFWEFQSVLDGSGWSSCVPGLLGGIKRPRNIYHEEVSGAGYALLAMAGSIGVAGLLCMFALFLSWDRMEAERARIQQQIQSDKARLQIQETGNQQIQLDKARMQIQETGKMDLAYEAKSVYDYEATSVAPEPDVWGNPIGSTHSPSIITTGSTEEGKIRLVLKLPLETESQELKMDFFNETEIYETSDDFLTDDEGIPPRSPTEVHVLVGGAEGGMQFIANDPEIAETDNKELSSGDDLSVDSAVKGSDEEVKRSDGDKVKRSDSEEVKGEENQDGGDQDNQVKGLITFFQEPASSTDDNLESVPPPPTTPPPPPPPPPATYGGAQGDTSPDQEFPPPPNGDIVDKFTVFTGDNVEVFIPATDL